MGRSAKVLAGIPLENPALYHRIRFAVGDPAAWLQIEGEGAPEKLLIVRDIEMERAKQQVAVDGVFSPADFTPVGGLSGDRATATAQSLAECLQRKGVVKVITDRTLPFIFAWHIQSIGLEIEYDPDLGVMERRTKDDQELEWLEQAQRVTEAAMLMACQKIARADAKTDGSLHDAQGPLTSERVQQEISVFLLEHGYVNPHGAIVATSPHSADCHARGSGPLVTGVPVIIDIFPQSTATRYWGDCTRTVVHGDATDEVRRMHRAVVAAKAAATATTRAGVNAEDVHAATKQVLADHGFQFARGQICDDPVMPHGTGHGIGLEVHEPILLDDAGGVLMEREVFTIEPGLYSRRSGGVRVEDMVVVSDGAARNLNRLPEGLDWR